jgi:hypothetical protein
MRNLPLFAIDWTSPGKDWQFRGGALGNYQEVAMPKSVYDRGLLKPADIARLQRVFDEACQRREAHPDSAEAREIALTLLALHNAGLIEEDMLMETVGFRRLEPKSA